MLVAMLRSAEEVCPAGRAAAVAGQRIDGVPVLALAKEGVYNAVGTCAYDLHDFLDFPSWFRSALAAVSSFPCVLSLICRHFSGHADLHVAHGAALRDDMSCLPDQMHAVSTAATMPLRHWSSAIRTICAP